MLLQRTVSFNSPSPWGIDDCHTGFVDANTFVEVGSCLEHVYGITPAIATAIHQTCQLAEHLVRHSECLTPIPSDLLAACEDLGERLLSWTFDCEQFATVPAEEDLMARIFYHHACAWHGAALIYYYRRIQHYDTKDLFEEVQNVVRYMQAVEDLKAGSTSESVKRMAPITWPMFIASCDGSESTAHLCRGWWESIRHYGLVNISRQWGVVQQIWAKRDEIQRMGLIPPEWTDIFSSLGARILPV